MTATNIQAYLRENYPKVAHEVADRLTSIECTNEIVCGIMVRAYNSVDEAWQAQIVTIAATLLLCSPETIHINQAVRRNSGVTTHVGQVLGISQQAVSKKVDRARHYYTHISWCRDAVNKVVKEVRGE